ncbi:hypothetical protein RhiirA4_467442 [Rhizophagus irregularis]|uniref:Uncharacterized protein n=1 Tax=Rhizophagus irregularis TaxID=588596 RepID=A0A2I1GVX6_9GLOM|nr:hypothetical protein RhiirA4_467442 [Rhizophagus irregularis]
MGPNVHIQRDADLGLRDINQNHNWTNDAQQQYSEEDIANASEFVRQSVSNNNNIISGRDNVIEYQNLNERIEKHYNDTISGQHVKPLRIMIMGTARTGKSYLMKAIRE